MTGLLSSTKKGKKNSNKSNGIKSHILKHFSVNALNLSAIHSFIQVYLAYKKYKTQLDPGVEKENDNEIDRPLERGK